MLADGVQPYPAEIYRWGMKKGGKPDLFDPNEVRQNILPLTEEGSVTEKGFYFKHKYQCWNAIEQSAYS